MTSRIFNVAGMSCDHCKTAVTRAVGALEGVDAVEVSLENNTATVRFEESRLALETIRQAIEAQGYEVGLSLVETDKQALAHELMEATKQKGVSLLLPEDVMVADSISTEATVEIVPITNIPVKKIVSRAAVFK